MLLEFIFDKSGKTHCVHESFHETGKKVRDLAGVLKFWPLAQATTQKTSKQGYIKGLVPLLYNSSVSIRYIIDCFWTTLF